MDSGRRDLLPFPATESNHTRSSHERPMAPQSSKEWKIPRKKTGATITSISKKQFIVNAGQSGNKELTIELLSSSCMQNTEPSWSSYSYAEVSGLISEISDLKTNFISWRKLCANHIKKWRQKLTEGTFVSFTFCEWSSLGIQLYLPR